MEWWKELENSWPLHIGCCSRSAMVLRWDSSQNLEVLFVDNSDILYNCWVCSLQCSNLTKSAEVLPLVSSESWKAIMERPNLGIGLLWIGTHICEPELGRWNVYELQWKTKELFNVAQKFVTLKQLKLSSHNLNWRLLVAWRPSMTVWQKWVWTSWRSVVKMICSQTTIGSFFGANIPTRILQQKTSRYLTCLLILPLIYKLVGNELVSLMIFDWRLSCVEAVNHQRKGRVERLNKGPGHNPTPVHRCGFWSPNCSVLLRLRVRVVAVSFIPYQKLQAIKG